MKKFIFIVVLLMLTSPCFAGKDVTMQCSYITQNSDFHIKLEPITLTTKGKVIMDNKIVGSVSNFDNNPKQLDILFDNGSSIFLDKEKMLSIYTVRIEGEPIYSYGSCMKQ